MAEPLYKIKDWDRCFENSESRKIKSLSWTPFPNRHDSAPFRRVAALKNAADVFAAWVLIVQVASKMPERGTLQNSSGPLTAEDLSLMTGFPEKIFAAAFEALQKPGINWISASLGDSPGTSRQVPASKETPVLQGTEQNRTEGHGREGKEEAASRPVDPLFLNPEFCEAWDAWGETRKGKSKLTDHARALNLAEVKRLSGDDIGVAIRIVNQTVRNGWKGFFEIKEEKDGKNGRHTQQFKSAHERKEDRWREALGLAPGGNPPRVNIVLPGVSPGGFVAGDPGHRDRLGYEGLGRDSDQPDF